MSRRSLYFLLAVVLLVTAGIFIAHRGQNRKSPGNPGAKIVRPSAPLSIGKPLPRLGAPQQAEPADTLPAAWTNGQLLAEERQPATNGSNLRVQILSMGGLHYPVRLEEVLERNADGREMVVGCLEMAADHLLARLKPNVEPDTLLAALRPAGVVSVKRVGPDGLVQLALADATPRSVPEALAGTASAGALLDYAEPDYVVHAFVTNPNDPDYLSGLLWSLRNTGQSGGVLDADIDADEAWDTRHDADTVIVAVIDTGIRYTHQDLAANMWINGAEIPGDGIDNDGNGVIDDVHGFNAINNTGNPLDDHGHGTHVAGTIGAYGNNNTGVVGVAWRVRLLAGKFLSASGSGFTSDAIRAIDYARTEGAQVMNSSWGGSGYDQSLVDAIDRARLAGILFVAAAGNDSVSSDFAPGYPAAYTNDNIVSVAATTRTDELASYSNWGLRSVDIAAPGSSIYSTYFSSDSSYTTLSGTSMAAPHVAGALALLRAQFPLATCSQLIDRLLATADHPASLIGRVRSQGRLNLARALTAGVIVPPPAVAQQPQDITVLAGGSAAFSITATGGTPLGFQWRKNGFDLPGATTTILSLSNVQAGDVGRYSVLVSNVTGLALSEEAMLTVGQPVAIVNQPQGATLPVDATFSTKVNVTGDPPIRYQWRKDGVDLPGKTEATLNLYGVTPNDAGSYIVRVTNAVSSATSSAAVLVVLTVPVITSQPQDQTNVVGGSAVFNATASGSAPLSYQWFKDGGAIAGATSSNLTLNSLGLSDGGAYSLRAANAAGQTWSAGAALTVKTSAGTTGYPQFVLQPTNQAVNPGLNVTFTGLATPGDVVYQWRKDGTNLPGASLPSLTILNVSLANGGFYTLIASNTQGVAASHGAQLTVRQAPAITTQPQSVVAVPGTQVVLEAAATGTDPLAYQWRKDGVALSGATNHRLTIVSVGAADTGTYALVVSNAAGTATSASATVSLTTTAITAWRQIDPGADMSILYCVAGAPDGIYIGSYDGAFSWTPDGGQTWSRRAAAGAARNITGVAYARGRYVAIGSDNNVGFSLTSSDGITWTRHTPGLPSGVTRLLRFNGSTFYYSLAGGLYFVWSADGITWNSVYTGSPRPLADVCLGPGNRYVCVGSFGTIYTSANGSSWSAAVSGTSQHLTGICTGPGGFVIVGDTGTILTSPNGLTWTQQPAVTSQRLNSVAFGNGRYVAVGGSTTTGSLQPAVTLVSTDAVNWRRTPNKSTDNLLNVAFVNGIFVAVGGNGYVFTSPDGEEWTLRRPPDAQRLWGIAYGNNRFVTVGTDGVIRNSADGLNWQTARAGQSQDFWTIGFGAGRYVAGTQDGALYSSTDAVNWDRQPTGAGVMRCVRYLNGRFFALTESGEILTSTDASSWARAPQVTGAPLEGITWNGSLYAVAGYDGTILTSPDGHNWAAQSTPTRVALSAITYGAGKFVAAGDQGLVLTSPNGTNWSLAYSGQSNPLYGVAYGMGLFVTAGWNGVILTSPDGVTWTMQSTNTSLYFHRLDVFNGKFVATGGGYVSYSSNGTNWTHISPDLLEDLAFGNGKYVGVGLSGRLQTSSDLNSWSRGSFGSLTSYVLTDVKFQGGKFVACGRNGNILTSTNGQDWMPQNSGWNSGIEELAYGAGRHVAVGTSGIILHSPDAVTWSQFFASGVSQWDGVTFGGGQFVAVGWPGAIFTSPNGITWTKRTSPTSAQINSVAYGNNTYVAVAFSGEILSSPDGINWAVQFNAGANVQTVTFSNGKFLAVASLFPPTVFSSTNGINWSSDSEMATSGNVYAMLDYQGATLAVGDWNVTQVAAPPPAITNQPRSQLVRIGSPVALSVGATSPGSLQYQWFKNGTLLPGATSPALSWPRLGSADAGNYFARVTGFGGTVDSIQAVLTVTQTPFDAWRIGIFGENNFLDPAQEATLWGVLADPDGDGLPNLAEYAFGENPLAKTASVLQPAVTNDHFRVTFVRRKNDPSLQITPQISSDLTTWHSGSGITEEVQCTLLDLDRERVTVEDVEVLPVKDCRFLRLHIQLNE